MRLPIFQVDAFTNKVFSGNPAAVCPLETWLNDKTMQSIAAENNLSETAFFVKNGNSYNIRWMTPTSEVPLCGHATLAAAFVIFNFIELKSKSVTFNSKSGLLSVERDGQMLILDFPAYNPKTIEPTPKLLAPFDQKPAEILFNESYLFVFDSEEYIRNYTPDFENLNKIDSETVIITAKGKKVDFVSRVFAPQVGIPEDPVTGSAHTVLIPYWSKKLNKTDMKALQVSQRGGELDCQNLGGRVKIGGNAVLYSMGEIML